jgi:ATP-dependent DNA helicase RecG
VTDRRHSPGLFDLATTPLQKRTHAPIERRAPEPARVSSDPLDARLSVISGVGPKRSDALRIRGLETLRDAIMHLPYRYEDLRRRDSVANLQPETLAVVEGELRNVSRRAMRGRGWRRMTTAIFDDRSGRTLRVVWFNLPGEGMMPGGERLLLAGKVTAGAGGALEMVHPDVHRPDSAPPIRPIYSLAQEIPQRLFAGIVVEGLRRLGERDIGAIPPELRAALDVASPSEALRYLHRPPPDADIEALETGATRAHRALAADEMFAFQLALARERARSRRRAGAVLNTPPRLSAELLAKLPFRPTGAQSRAMEEIAAGLAEHSQMNRMLIGDVGSGKTLVAFHAVLRAVESGWQAAVMAPTELLAEQHFATFSKTCGALGVTAALLTGKVAGAERARLLRALGRGDVPVVFGTHALIQDGVKMARLGLAVIDEQHRFGVFDRARLIGIGSQANVLLMTATPIPRSLALALFRNIDVSTLEEMPPGRTPVATQCFGEDKLAEVDAIVAEELRRGNRAYYVLPLIEGEEDDAASVTAAAKRLTQGPLREFSIGLLHGRMRPVEKDRAMREFRDGAIQALVSTTVVEVGIDVPEASIIVIVAAERYGLAQLHQLRGRVGRGAAASRCCLVLSRGVGATAAARVAALARTANGPEVAELDLRMRGPGDLFGARQAGALPLRFTGLIRDYDLITRVGDAAEEWLKRDPALDSPASAGARQALARMLDFGFSLGDVG